MKNLDLINDVVPPIAVAAINIAAQKQTQLVLGVTMQQALNYGMTAAGYLSAAMGWGGKYNDFLKNVGIAAAPAALISLYKQSCHPDPACQHPENAACFTVSRPRRGITFPGCPPRLTWDSFRTPARMAVDRSNILRWRY